MDSRGVDFDKILLPLLDSSSINVSVKILAVRGATLQSIERKAKEELSNTRYDMVYVMLGVNNITRLFYKKQIICAFENIPTMVDTMDDLFTVLKTNLSLLAPKIIVCHLLGLDLLVYNLKKKGQDELLTADYPRMQMIINEAVIHINNSINSMNLSSNVIGPWLADTIHSHTNGRIVHKYPRLHDGLHPDSATKKLWAKKLVKSIQDNL